MAHALGAGTSADRPRVGIARWYVVLACLGPLALGVTLANVGRVILLKVAAVHSLYRLTPRLELVLRADTAFGWQIIVLGLALCMCAVTATPPVLHRFYPNGRPWILHLAWNASGFVWLVFYVLLASLLGVAGDQRIAVAQIVAPLLVAVVCFVQGTTLPATRNGSTVSDRRLVGMLGLGFFLVSLTDLLTFDETNALVRQVGAAFQDPYVDKVLDSVNLPSDYWLVTPAGDPVLASFLAISPWLMLSYAYVLTIVTPYDLPSFFRCCPVYPPGIRQLIYGILARRSVVYAFVPGAVGILPIVIGTIVAEQDPLGSQVRQFATVFPLYLLLFLPAACRSWMIKASNWNGAVVDTRRRQEVLRQERFSLSLLLFTAGLVGGSLLLWAQRAGAASAIGFIDEIGKLIPRSASAPVLWSFTAMAFVWISIHYLGLVEVPYWIGQRQWRVAQLGVAEHALRDAEDALRADLADEPASDRSMVNESGTTVRRLARYIVAREQRQVAHEIPLHSVDTLFGAVKLIARSLVIALIATGLGFEEPNGTKELSNVLKEIVGLIFSGK